VDALPADQRLAWLSDTYDRHAAVAFALALRITGTESIAEQVVERAFLTILASGGPLVPAEDLEKQVRTAVCQTALAMLRASPRPTDPGARDRAWEDAAEHAAASGVEAG
jgi:DNA-directed RNA polymerase specialized sigma24 family protein